jgi:hypothetical protein
VLRVIAAAVLGSRGLLLVSKRAAPAAEIAALRWWPDEPGLGLAPAVRDCVIPRLRLAGRL